MKTDFMPELTLDHHQRAALARTTSEEGYRVIHLIARSEVDKFIVALMNISSADPAAVVEGHRVSKTAAMLYEGITNRINKEVQNYINATSEPAAPVDITEGILEIGPPASTFQDLELSEEEADIDGI